MAKAEDGTVEHGPQDLEDGAGLDLIRWMMEWRTAVSKGQPADMFSLPAMGLCVDSVLAHP